MKKQKGVALLVTLSATLILGIFLANNFERNRTNLKLLSNEESKFSLNTINFSILKAVTLAVKEEGANYVYDFVSILGSVPDFPISLAKDPDIDILNPKVWSMDHYYYLNRDYNDSNEVSLFNGILKQNLEKVSFTQGDGKIELGDRTFTEELKRWKTRTGNSGLSNKLPIYRRGSSFDLDSEFYFLVTQGLKKKNAIPEEDFYKELNFRVLATNGKKNTALRDDLSGKSPCSLASFNLNMLPKNSKSSADKTIEKYIEWFSFHNSNDCKNIKNSKDQILDAIKRRFYPDDRGVFLITDIGNNNFNSNLSGFNVTDAKARAQFTYRSNLVGISYQVQNRAIRLNIETHLYLEYKENNNTDIPDAVHILYYNVK